MNTLRSHRILIAILLFAVVLGSISYLQRQSIITRVQVLLARLEPAPERLFPIIDSQQFSPAQLKLLEQLETEYNKKPTTYDENVLKYTGGVKESWCADFVSWNMKQLGQPLENPHSGGWKIPGVYTLRDYYQAQNRWQSAGSYVPSFGDVAFYVRSPSKSHVNFVLSVDAKASTMTTLGGNEEGYIRIKTKSYLLGKEDLAGFGKLAQ